MQAPDSEIQHIVNKAVARFDCNSPGVLVAFLSEVLQWNRTLGLVSRKDPVAASERLLFESLELARELRLERERIVDIGSGAGFPGLVWALTMPGLEVTMIERRERRALFLERACRTLPAPNATAMAMDALVAARSAEFQGAFDLAVTMAVGDPSSLAGAIEPMLAADGRLASTIPGASTPPPQIGRALHLERRSEGEFGCYVIYRRGV
jgi:16S rRNA (guanine527-N7)-methyltransferase